VARPHGGATGLRRFIEFHRRERWRPGGAATKAAPKEELGGRRQSLRVHRNSATKNGGPGGAASKAAPEEELEETAGERVPTANGGSDSPSLAFEARLT
jgi:hypothetical protein